MTGTTVLPHVVVVGGGLAGMAAALESADAGARVTLLERRSRLGGLTWSFEHNGYSIDNGQHVFMRCCTGYLAFLDRIGSRADVALQDRLDVPVVSPAIRSGGRPRTGRIYRSGWPVPLHLGGALLRYPHLRWPERVGLGRAVAGLMRMALDDPALDDVTFGAWLAQRGQSADAIEAIWDLITVPTVNLPASEASLAVAAKVFKTGLLSAPGAGDIGWSRLPLGRLHGERGMEALQRSGVDVRTAVKVLAVEAVGALDDHSFVVRSDAGSLEADAVVMALPPEESAGVLPRGVIGHQDRLDELGHSAIVNVHLVFDHRVTKWEFLAGCHSPVQFTFDRTASSGLGGDPAGPQYLAVSLSAADHLLGRHPDDLVEWITSEIGRLLPGAAEARVIDSLVTKERHATFRARPGSGKLRPGPRTAVPGLALAGAWTATGWPATMEGAVRSGVAAAQSCVASAGLARATMSVPPVPQFARSNPTEEVA